MKMFNDTLTRLMATAFFLGLFLHFPAMDNMLLDLTAADPEIITFFQIGALIGAVSTLIGGEGI